MEKKVLAGQLDLVDRDFASIEKDVIGEEVRQNGEAAGALESQRRVLSVHPVLNFDEEITFLKTEASHSRLGGDFELDGRPAIFPERDPVIDNTGGQHKTPSVD